MPKKKHDSTKIIFSPIAPISLLLDNILLFYTLEVFFVRVLFIGSGEFGCPSLAWLAASSYDLLEVITQPARPAGRGRQPRPTAIAQLADQLHLTCRPTDNVNDPVFIRHINDLQPDILLVIAFGQKIGSDLLDNSAYKCINLHASLLPCYRGAAPINWAIINGDRRTGLSVIQLNEQWDAGPIWGQITTDILPGETAGRLHDRLAELGPQLLAQTLEKLAAGVLEPVRQDDSLATYAPKLSKTDGAIHWSLPAVQLCRHILAMWPWPGAYCFLAKSDQSSPTRLAIARAEVVSPSAADIPLSATQPGRLAEDMSIICGIGRLKLLQVKPDNGKLMDFADFVNGWHLHPGDLFLDG